MECKVAHEKKPREGHEERKKTDILLSLWKISKECGAPVLFYFFPIVENNLYKEHTEEKLSALEFSD